LTFFRVYSGKIEAGSYIYNSRSGKKEQLVHILLSLWFYRNTNNRFREIHRFQYNRCIFITVQKGFTTAMKNGVLAGYPLDSLKVTLLDGSFHPSLSKVFINRTDIYYNISKFTTTTRLLLINFTQVNCLDIIVNIGPVDEDFTQGGLQFIDEVKGGNIPKEFIPTSRKLTVFVIASL